LAVCPLWAWGQGQWERCPKEAPLA
jgi:hypothetical protein